MKRAAAYDEDLEDEFSGEAVQEKKRRGKQKKKAPRIPNIATRQGWMRDHATYKRPKDLGGDEALLVSHLPYTCFFFSFLSYRASELLFREEDGHIYAGQAPVLHILRKVRERG